MSRPGAMPGTAVTHIAIVEALDGMSADWMTKLDDAGCSAAPSSAD